MGARQARPYATRQLDGIWEFEWLGSEVDLSGAALESGAVLDGLTFPDRAVVPSCFDVRPDLAGARGTAAYRTMVYQADEDAGELYFDGVGMWVAVYVDRQLCRVHRKPYSPCIVDVPCVSGGGGPPREVIVLVDNRFDAVRSPLQENYFDFYAYGGIFRPVSYVALPVDHILDVRVTTLEIDPPQVSVAIKTNTSRGASVQYLVDGQEVASTADALPVTETPDGYQEVRVSLPGRALWSPDSPELHTLTVIMETLQSRDEYELAFGIRSVAVQGSNLLLNGEPLSLFGWNRHESHPQYGPALSPQQMEQDIRIMQHAGASFVRGAHYPQDDRFLDLCDRLGVLVWEESIGWQQDTPHFSNKDYQELIVQQQEEMIRSHAHHPSIIMWGFQNELHSEVPEAREVISRLAHVTRLADPTRPVTFASCRFPEDRCLDLVDIVSLNIYPGWYAEDKERYRPLQEIGERLDRIRAALGEQGLDNKPLIISEIGAGALYGWRDAQAGHWSEQYQSDYLTEVCGQFRAREDVMGLALWQFCDCRTYGSARALGRPRTFNNKGIVDEYRRPKEAYTAICRLMQERPE
jgi:beta-glucuronidase